jgi:hypothetical protein
MAMIRRIFWPQPSRNEPPSPFAWGVDDRILKITLHSGSFSNIFGIEAKAIKALWELSQIPDLYVADTTKGNLPFLSLENVNENSDYLVAKLEESRSCSRAAIGHPREWFDLSQVYASKLGNKNPKGQGPFEQILIARAHSEFHHDLFVTLSPLLLANRDGKLFRETNIVTPAEAIKVVGLYLRLRENYIIEAFGKATASLSRWLFYWVLVRHKLPRMWKYFSACVYADKKRNDNTLSLGGSILTRCTRAIIARDQIGFQFYNYGGNESADTMMYHFDYLTILLSGAFDAMARIAHRAYSVKSPKERFTSFRKSKFIETLEDIKAKELSTIVQDNKFKDLMFLLSELRNTIHGANLTTLRYINTERMGLSFVHLTDENALLIWEATQRYASAEKWGVIRENQILIEPYTYSTMLIDECFRYINAIALATDVDKLFPPGVTPQFTTRPPKGGGFEKHTRKRVYLLG